jgi:hypothetical protein
MVWKMVSYHYEIKTADEYQAGTDSNIFVTLIGKNESGSDIETEEQRLNGHISGNAFERGDLDEFDVPYGISVGKPYKIKLRSDCRYAGSGWKCGYIKVGFGSDLAYFKINAWIDDKKDHEYTV